MTRTLPDWFFLSLKGGVCAFMCAGTIFVPESLEYLFTYSFSHVRVFHLLWAFAILFMAKRLFPSINRRIASGKIFGRNYLGTEGINEKKLAMMLTSKNAADRGALISAFSWIGVIVVIGLFVYCLSLPALWVYVIISFFIFMDQFCATVWCPFQRLTKARCCNLCRINNWGYLMAFAPLVFVPSFWNYTVLSVAALLVVQWEYLYFRYPERFYAVTNKNLACRTCENRLDCSGKRN